MTPTYRSEASTSAPRPSNANAVPTISSGNAKGAGLAETDGSIARISTRSPDSSRPFPRFSPGAWAAGGTHVHFPPRAVEHFVPSGAHECMYVPGMSWGNPRGRPVNNVVRIHAEEPRRPS